MRVRLKLALAAGLLPALAACPAADPPPAHDDALVAAFAVPPAAARPETLWYWMNGNVSADGITRDLEAMHDVGVGRAILFDGGVDAPPGPAGYLDDEWRALLRHAVEEANRIGIELGAHNAPGWSSSGGPWITPPLSMQQLVWTETAVEGDGDVNVLLPRPYANLGYYEDAVVIAFPSQAGEQEPYARAIRSARAGRNAVDVAALADADPDTFVRVDARDGIVLDFGEPYRARALTVALAGPYSPQSVRLELSDDGLGWRTIGTAEIPYPRSIEAPGVTSFDAVQARFYRLVPDRDADVAELRLHSAPRLEDWPYKAEFAFQMTAARQRVPATMHRDAAIDPAAVLDVTPFMDSGGRLRWQAPPGSWTVLRFGHTTTGKHNVAASTAGDGLEVDKLSAAAADFHFDHGPGQIIELAGSHAGETLSALMIDSYEADLQNWTATLPADFEARNDYSIVPWMAALTGRIVGDAAQSERFLFDFRRTLADLMADNYFGRLQERTNAHGMELLVEGYGPGMFDELAVSGRADVPTTEFWARTPWTDNRTVKMVASAAHVYGKPVVAAEAFTAEAQTGRWQGHPYAYKTLGDLMFSLGYNHTVFHRYVHQPHPDAAPGMVMGPWGMNFERTNTWFGRSKPWLDYLSRTQLMLRQGRFVADVLYFVGGDTPDGAQYVRPNVSPEASPRIVTYDSPAIPPGHDYDLVNAEVLLDRARVVDGAIEIEGGSSYRLLAFPDEATALTPELAVRLRDLVRQGMVLLAPKPLQSLGLRESGATSSAFADAVAELWGDAAVPPAGRRVGAGRVFSDVPLRQVLESVGVPPDVTCVPRRVDGQVAWLHRATVERDIYFVANRQRRREAVTCSFRVPGGRAPALWHADDGSIRQAAVYSRGDGRTLVDLDLGPAEAVFVVFEDGGSSRPIAWAEHDGNRFAAAELPATGRPAAPAETFTVSLWAKPDVELRAMPEESATGTANETGKSWVVPARAGDELYGAGHAAMALAVGRNGVVVLERSTGSAPAVLVAHEPIAGWTHVAVVYDDGTPSLYVDGRHVRTGLKSGSIVHPGGLAAPVPVGVTYFFEGDNTEPRIVARALGAAEIAAAAAEGLPDPALSARPADLWRDPSGRLHVLAWRSGEYRFDTGDPFTADVPAPLVVGGPWTIGFPEGLGAPASLTVDSLASLRLSDDPGVRHFSGTATYRKRVEVPALAPGERAFLDLGRVDVIADVRLNGMDAGQAWKPPYRVEVTPLLRAGANDLEIDVTTTWTNRLIGDAALPSPYRYSPVGGNWIAHDPGPDAAGNSRALAAQMIEMLPDWYRDGSPAPDTAAVSFSTGMFHAADEPLVEAGLLGPVRLVIGEHRVLE